MMDKGYITKRLEKFFNICNIDSFIKVIIISFIYDKANYIEKIVGNDNSLNMTEKYIYNLENNLKKVTKLDNYHSIYAKYDYETKKLKYFTSSDYKKIGPIKLNQEEKKQLLIQEFKIMMYKELERIINIYAVNDKIVSNLFYIEDYQGRYPEYYGNFSDLADVFEETEVCNINGKGKKIKIYIDDEKKYFVYEEHFSSRNSQVVSYVKLWRMFLDEKLYYFAVNNPNKYSEMMIKEFNEKYVSIFDAKYDFMLKSKDVFSLIESYILHIRNRVNEEYNVKYHQDISVIFELMQRVKKMPKYTEYLLHATNKCDMLEYENVEEF